MSPARSLSGDDARLVSVIIPSFNRAAMVVELLDALVAQSWRPLEIIVVDDGSGDDTQQRLADWVAPDSGITLISIHQPNAGPSAARNRGLANARGEFVYFIDSDDLIHPGAIADLVQALTASGKAFCVANIMATDIHGVPVAHTAECIPEINPSRPMKSRWMTHAALYRMDCVLVAGRYDERLRFNEDIEFHWRVSATHGPGHRLDALVGIRRQHDFGHLSIGRTDDDIARHGLAALVAFSQWSVQTGRLSRSTATCMVRNLFIVGLRLGGAGDQPAKRQAFSLMASLGTAGLLRARLVAMLGVPDRPLYFRTLLGLTMLGLTLRAHLLRNRRGMNSA